MQKVDPSDPRLEEWVKPKGSSCQEIEAQVSQHLLEHFTYLCFAVPEMNERLYLEGRMIAQLAQHPIAAPSAHWLGHHANDEKIGHVGMWNIDHITGAPLADPDLDRIGVLIAAT